MTLDQKFALVSLIVAIVAPWITHKIGVKQGERLQRQRDEIRKRESFSVRLKANIRVEAVNPFPHSETFMAIELTLTNLSEVAVFLKAANLVRFSVEEGRSVLGFLGKAVMATPREFKPNEQLVETYKAGIVHQTSNDSPRFLVRDEHHRKFESDLIRKVCSSDAFFEVITSQSRYKFPVKETCDDNVEMWPHYYPSIKDRNLIG